MADAEQTGSSPQGVKPATITLRVKDQTGEEPIHFKVKTTTMMGKVFRAYAQRKGLEMGALRFLLDADRLTDLKTVEASGLEDGDQIDVHLEMVGGGGSGSRSRSGSVSATGQ